MYLQEACFVANGRFLLSLREKLAFDLQRYSNGISAIRQLIISLPAVLSNSIYLYDNTYNLYVSQIAWSGVECIPLLTKTNGMFMNKRLFAILRHFMTFMLRTAMTYTIMMVGSCLRKIIPKLYHWMITIQRIMTTVRVWWKCHIHISPIFRSCVVPLWHHLDWKKSLDKISDSNRVGCYVASIFSLQCNKYFIGVS